MDKRKVSSPSRIQTQLLECIHYTDYSVPIANAIPNASVRDLSTSPYIITYVVEKTKLKNLNWGGGGVLIRCACVASKVVCIMTV
jgi:hypothetical protein